MVYRLIYPSFWSDPKVEDDFTPEDKYFFLYLLTNPHTNLCGCYEIGTKAMVRETGYNEDTISRLLKRMEQNHDVIRYDRNTKEVLILNWHKYNWTKSEKLLSGVEKTAAYIKNPDFKEYVLSLVNGVDTLCIPYAYPMDTSVSVSVTESVSNLEDRGVGEGDFSRFWEAYPKKVAKQNAVKAWKKVDAPIDTILTALEGQKKSKDWQKDGGQYIPYPATWLNQRRWEDAPTEIKSEYRRFMEGLANVK